jgi:ATP-binding cassette subfamily B protein
MTLIYSLLQEFFYEERWTTVFMVLSSLSNSIIQSNGISFITASIISSMQENNKKMAYTYFKYLIVLVILYLIVASIFKYFKTQILTKLRQWMRHKLISTVLKVNNENFSGINFTKLNSPINRISSVSFMVFSDIISFILPNTMFLLVVSAFFIYKNWMFGLGFFLANVCIVIFIIFNWNVLLEKNTNYEEQIGHNESYLMEILNNVDKIIYRGQTENEIAIYDEKTKKGIQKSYEFYSTTDYYNTLLNLFVYLIVFFSIYTLIYLYFSKKISITIFITFFSILLLYREKIKTLNGQIPDMIEFLGRTDTVLKHFKEMEKDVPYIGTKQYESHDLPFNQIVFDKVSFTYPTGETPVFTEKSITVDLPDKIIGVMGLSGNGKSTFMKLILKLNKLNGGRILIDGVDIQVLDPDYIRKNMIYVSQNSKLFDKKVIDNMMYGCNDEHHSVCSQRLDEILKYPKITELYRNLDVNETQSGSLGENLSGGQRQIVNIIGGLIHPSKIVILDEPTNALDPGLKRELLGLIRDFRKYKRTIIVITHDKDVEPLFDETIKL